MAPPPAEPETSGVPELEIVPGAHVPGMDVSELLSRGRDGFDAREMGFHARRVCRDLSSDLGLVDELGGEDAIDGTGGLGFGRSPIVRALEVERQIGPERLVFGTATSEREAESE